MSFARRVLLLLAAVLLLALAGTLLIQGRVLRDTLQQQLQARNEEAAAAMAAAWSPLSADADRLVAAASTAWATGRYQTLRLQVPDGAPLADLQSPAAQRAGGAAGWSTALLPLSAPAGRATLFGAGGRVELSVELPAASAQLALWRSLSQTAALLAALAASAVVVAAWALRHWQQPLQRVLEQAQALQQGRFVESPEAGLPDPPELRQLTRSLNATVRRLQDTYAAQAAQVALLQRQAQLDPVTGLPLRQHFIGQLEQRLAAPGGPGAALILVRVVQLDSLNPRLGHEATDRLLAAIGSVLLTYVDRVSGTFAGRLNGSDFALCLPVTGVAAETTESLRAALSSAPALRSGAADVVLGAVDSLRDTTGGNALAAADAALAEAEVAADAGRGAGVAVEHGADSAAPAGGARAWREQIAQALAEHRTQLAEFHVLDRHGRLLHLECPLRVQMSEGDGFQAAASWLALARRSRLMPQVDLAALDLALQAVAADGRARAVHAAPASLAAPGFAAAVARLLRAQPVAARQISIECIEGQRPAGSVALAEAVAAWRPCGVRIGIEHAGASPQQLPQLQAVGIDYVKVDARHLRGAAIDEAVRGYAHSLVALIHGLGMVALAQGIDDSADLAALWELGFDGATGPAVRLADLSLPTELVS